MLFENNDDRQDVSDTIGQMADGVSDGADKVGDAIAADVDQTVEDAKRGADAVGDALLGEDGDNH